jgi:hypothetical protein
MVSVAVRPTCLAAGGNRKGPFYNPPAKGTKAPWRVEWLIFFSDNKYIRICENYNAAPKAQGGEGVRAHLSYHYGDVPQRRTPQGLPLWGLDEPTDLRMDLDSDRGPHLHYAGENHIPQTRVDGLDISRFDLFTFVAGIFEHRANGKPLNEVFGFKIRT